MSLYNADDESAAPTTPATGRKILYPKADGWYYKDDAGVEHQLANSSGAVLTLPQINDTSSDHQYIFAVNELTADRIVTLPLLTGNDEFVFKDFTQALTNKTINGNTITSGSGTLALGAGKTLTASNTLTLTATDGSTLAIGTGGTLGTAAYIAASSKQDVDATLTSLAALGTAADKLAYTTGVDTWAETAFTAAARTVLDDATVSAMVDTLGGAASTGTGGLVRQASPTFTGTMTADVLTTTGNATIGNASTDTHRINGLIGINAASSSEAQLFIGGTPALSGSTQEALKIQSAAGASMSNWYQIDSFPVTNNTGITIGAVAAIHARNAAKGGTDTITNLYGMLVDDLAAGGSNYGVASMVSSGANKWNIYAGGTANNAFVGSVRIGSTAAPTVALDVTGAISATTTIRTGGYLVSTLPAGTTGDRAYVTDATSPTYLGALTGGGAVVCPVFKNASAWVSA